MNQTRESTLTFIGNHPSSGSPICGLLTSHFDCEDIPLSAHIDGDHVIVASQSRSVSYKIPATLAEAIGEGITFYVANVGGSEESFEVTVTSRC